MNKILLLNSSRLKKKRFMLSINIPVYNIEVKDLVLQLIREVQRLDILFEIRVYDDCSLDEIKSINRKIAEFENVVYLELEKNLGRSAIRNKMGMESAFRYLLFIDADSKIVRSNYLKSFLNSVQPKRVLCGGTAYQKEKPKDNKKLLRWVYGINREAVSAAIRNNKKGFIISSNNFLIEKEVFQKIHFREEINNYGHEDTLLGYDLFQNEIEIYHIHNPLEHTGLEDSQVFVEKTKIALISLYKIVNELLAGNSEFVKQVYFLNKYSKIKKFVPAGVFRFIYKIGSSTIEKNLLGKNPKLFLFDIYKVCFYSTIKK